jgi:cytolysin-activating lysine-acyltransferase
MTDAKLNGAAKGGSMPSSAILGEMAWLYSMSELHRTWPMGSIHQWLLPALINKQYRIYHRGNKPVGLVTWAHLTAETETAYVRNTRSLQPKDWTGGDRNWIIDFIAPFGDALRIGHDLRSNVFPNDVGRILQVQKGSDTMKIAYIHGVKAVDKARDWDANPTVDLGQDTASKETPNE